MAKKKDALDPYETFPTIFRQTAFVFDHVLARADAAFEYDSRRIKRGSPRRCSGPRGRTRSRGRGFGRRRARRDAAREFPRT